MTRKRRRELSRRQFLKGTAAAGLAVSLPGFVAGCGDGGGSSAATPTPTPLPGRGPRERRTLHFDVSHGGPLREAHLGALNSDSDRTPLKAHTAATRLRFRQSTPELNAVPDAQLTHYVEDADVPASALQMITVLGTTSSGAPALLGAYINIPSPTLQEYATRALRGAAPMPTALMKRYGTAAMAEELGRTLLFNNSYVNPLTTAVALCFHHPEVMNLNTTLGANTLVGYIQNLPAASTLKWVDGLAQFLGTPANNPATTTPGGWATLVPQTDASGKPVTDQNGDPIYGYTLSAGTLAAMTTPIQEVLKAVFDDPQYEGSNWNATSGLRCVEQAVAAAQAAQGTGAQDSPFTVQATIPVGSVCSGIEVVGLAVTDPVNRGVQLTIKNRFLRWLIAYVQYLDAGGDPLPFVSTNVNDSPRAYYIAEITSNNQIMGIPLMGNNVGSTCLDFTMPGTATTARVIIGGLGCGGGDSYCPEAVGGSVMTLVYNIGIPTMLLAVGVGADALENSALDKLAPALRPILTSIVDSGLFADYAVGIYGSETSKSAGCFLSAVANSVIQALLTQAPEAFAQFLATVVSEAAVEKAVPIVGFAFEALGIAASLAAIAVAEAEVLKSQALTCNDISLAFDINVTIEHDPEDFRFPPEADTYVATATLDSSSTPYRVSGAIPTPGETGPLGATITGVPSGGTVTIEVCLTNGETGFLAAVGTINVPATLAGAGSVTVQVTNKLVPLTAQTQYQHDLKLEYQNGARVWVQTPQAPSATVSELGCAKNDTLCQISQITVSPRAGMVGYAWRTGGLGVGQCGGGPSGSLYTFQNLFAAPPAESGLKFPGCGFATPAGLVYDPSGPASGVGNNFYFEPSADGDGFYVRSVVLDTATGFDLSPGMNWGRFTQALDSLAVHPAGYVAGVSAATHTMEILRLPSAPVSDSDPPMSPWAAMRGGYGTRAGLLNTPIAVTVHCGAVLVLEQTNLRIQALDLDGNPINYFAGQTTPFAPLMSESEVPVYLDLSSDALGYLFVLSYVGGGVSAADYRLDVYDPDGNFLTRTTGVAVARMTVDPFRTVYTVNYEVLAGAPRVEPSVSQWLPSLPTS